MDLASLKNRWESLGTKRRYLKGALGVLIGASLGYAYYAFIGCSSGGCAITSDPWTSVAWGSLIGGLWSLG